MKNPKVIVSEDYYEVSAFKKFISAFIFALFFISIIFMAILIAIPDLLKLYFLINTMI